MSADLLALADRCEAATGPDTGLDVEIALTVFERRYPRKYDYTASLDAAMTLVPEGRDWGFDSKDGLAFIYPRNTRGTLYRGKGTTPALALCAAALRARAT